MGIIKQSFGNISNGTDIELYTLKNAKGHQVQITNYGARVVSWTVTDKNSKSIDIVLGYSDAAGYEKDNKYMGAIAGRCANRIGGAKFTLNGKEYQLDVNDGGKNHLHGGFNGFEKKIWKAEIVDESLKLSCKSADGECGYPGNLNASVTYTFTDDDELKIAYEANSDKDTICNLTNHTYFNLNGFSSGSILNQKIQIFADKYTWASSESIPDGRILNVEGTPMDLRNLTRIGEHIDDDFDELNFGHGYDHNWCINEYDGKIKKTAHATSDESGIGLTVFTTLPGIQFYAGNFLDGDPIGKDDVACGRRSGFALETQFYPNAINIPQFPQPILRAGETWKSQTIYKVEINN